MTTAMYWDCDARMNKLAHFPHPELLLEWQGQISLFDTQADCAIKVSPARLAGAVSGPALDVAL